MQLETEFRLYISSFGHYLVQQLLTQMVPLKESFEYGICRILQPLQGNSTFDAILMNVM